MDAARAASLLRDADLVPLLIHPDADSVLAAGLVARALQKAGVPWHARAAAALDAGALAFLAEEAPGSPVVLAGLGQREAPAVDGLGRDVVVLDARLPAAAPVPKQALVLGDGRAAPSAAVLALPLARALDPRAPAMLALAGLDAAGPAPGTAGLRARFLDDASQQGAQALPGPALAPGPLVEALAGAADPFLPGLSGRARASKAFLEPLGLAGRATEDLGPEQAERLASALTFHLLARGAAPAAAHALLEPDARAAVPGGTARGLARLARAACEAGRPGLALALAVGEAAMEAEALGLAEARRHRLLQALMKMEGDGGAAADGLVHAEADLAPDLAWAAAVALRHGTPTAAASGAGGLHVAAPGVDPLFLGSAAAEAAEGFGGRGWARGARAVLEVPAGRSPEAWAQLRTRLEAGA